MATTTVYFATNRRPNDDKKPTEFTHEFTGDMDSLRFGSAEVPGAELFRSNDLEALGGKAAISVAAEKLDPTDASKSKLGSVEVFARVRDAIRAGADALVYVHGYNYAFRESVARAAQLSQWYGPKGDLVVLLFAWPSPGLGVAPTTYRDERERARASGIALGRAILKSVDFIRGQAREDRCLGRIHLMAHSMGNWALRGAIQSMRTFVGDNIPPLFDQVLLMAADEDDDTLSEPKKLAPLLRGCARVTVYYNVQDLALKSSDWAMGNPDRLGRSGPLRPADLPPKIVPVNVAPAVIWQGRAKTPAWQVDETGHQYYRNNPSVRDDALEVLAGTMDGDIKGRTDRGDYYRLG
jgi:esterase/lipase superfamily enzyme